MTTVSSNGHSDIIGGFQESTCECKGCGQPLWLANAWMADGCPCNSELGCNNTNEQRWRLLMMLQQDQAKKIDSLKVVLRQVALNASMAAL